MTATVRRIRFNMSWVRTRQGRVFLISPSWVGSRLARQMSPRLSPVGSFRRAVLERLPLVDLFFERPVPRQRSTDATRTNPNGSPS